MKKASAIIAILVVTAIAATAVWQSEEPARGAGATLRGLDLVVSGPDNTLASIAAQLGRPEVFRYDASKRLAVCDANLMVEGVLRIGDPGDGAARETLEFNSKVCGDRVLRVSKTGELHLTNATITTVDKIVTNKLCTQGYALFVAGKLRMERSRLSFMVTELSLPLRNDAQADITNSRFSCNEGYAFSCKNVNGDSIRISDCLFSTESNWGFMVEGTRGRAVTLHDSTFSGQAGDVLNAGQNAEIVLVDCDFRKDRLAFSQSNGSIAVKWRLRVKVSGREDLTNLKVVATSVPSVGRKEKVVGRTDDRGECLLTLTEFLATSRHRFRQKGINDSTPHRIGVFSSPENLQLGEEQRMDVVGKGMEVDIAVQD